MPAQSLIHFPLDIPRIWLLTRFNKSDLLDASKGAILAVQRSFWGVVSVLDPFQGCICALAPEALSFCAIFAYKPSLQSQF